MRYPIKFFHNVSTCSRVGYMLSVILILISSGNVIVLQNFQRTHQTNRIPVQYGKTVLCIKTWSRGAGFRLYRAALVNLDFLPFNTSTTTTRSTTRHWTRTFNGDSWIVMWINVAFLGLQQTSALNPFQTALATVPNPKFAAITLGRSSSSLGGLEQARLCWSPWWGATRCITRSILNPSFFAMETGRAITPCVLPIMAVTVPRTRMMTHMRFKY